MSEANGTHITLEANENSIAKVEACVEMRNFGHGLDATERRINRLEEAATTLSGDIWSYEYDIPQGEPNPSNLLWFYGFRKSLSCWVFPEKGLNAPRVQALIKRYNEKGYTVDLIRYHPDDLKLVRAKARAKLTEEIIRVHTSLIARLGAASNRLKDAVAEFDHMENFGIEVTPKQRDATQQKYNNDVRAILRTASENLAASISCAEMFDETESTAVLIDGLRKAVRAEAEAFNAQMRMQGRKEVALANIDNPVAERNLFDA